MLRRTIDCFPWIVFLALCVVLGCAKVADIASDKDQSATTDGLEDLARDQADRSDGNPGGDLDAGLGDQDDQSSDSGAEDLQNDTLTPDKNGPQTGKFLAPCSDNKQCESGFCIKYLEGFICSRKCLQDCPENWSCKGVLNTVPDVVFICFPDSECPQECKFGCDAETQVCFEQLVANAGDDQHVQKGDSVNLYGIATGGDGKYSCTWRDPGGTIISSPKCDVALVANTSGTYQLEVTDGSGNKAVDSVSLTVSEPLTAEAGDPQNVTESETANLVGTHTGGIGDKSCEWFVDTVKIASECSFTTPALSATITYTLKVSDSANHTASDSVTISVSKPLSANAGADQVIVTGASTDLSGTFAGGVGTPTCNWTWTDKDGQAQTKSGCTISTGALPQDTVFTLTVTDEAQKSATDDVSVKVVNTLTAVPGPDQDIISGTTTDLSGSGVGGSGVITCEWKVDSQVVSTVCNFTTLALNANTTFSLTVKDELDNTDTKSMLVRVHQGLVAKAGDDQQRLSGQTATLDGTYEGGVGAVTCRWLVGTTVVASSCNFTTAALDTTTTFTLEVTDTKSNTATDDVLVEVFPTLVAKAGSDHKIIKDNTVQLSGIGEGGIGVKSCRWLIGQTLQSESCAFETAKLNVNTTFTLEVKDEAGNTATDDVLVEVFDPLVAKAGDDDDVLKGQPALLSGSSSGGIGTVTCRWLIGSVEKSTSCTYTTELLTTATTFTLEVKDQAGNTATDDVLIKAHNPLTADAGDDRLVIKGDIPVDGTYSGGIGAVTCEWLDGSTKIGDGCSTTLKLDTDVTLTLKVTDSKNNSASDDVVFTVKAIVADAGPDVEITKGDPTTLNGTATGPAGYTCEWRDVTNPGVVLSTDCSYQVSPDVTTEYELTAITPADEKDTDTVIVKVRLPLIADAGPDQKSISGATVTLTGTYQNGEQPVTCAWYVGTDTTGTAFATTCTTTVTPTADTTYTLKVSDNRGDSDSNSMDLSIVAIIANAGDDKVIDLGESTTLNGTYAGGVEPVTCQWNWSELEGGVAVNKTFDGCDLAVTKPGFVRNYTLTVTDKDGNKDSDTATVFIKGGAINLCNWSEINFEIRPDEDKKGPGNWDPNVNPCDSSNTAVSFLQTINSLPTGWLSDLVVSNVKISGTLWSGTAVDDDFIGIIWGWQDPQHFYMLSWKGGSQARTACNDAYAPEGIGITKFDGLGTDFLNSDPYYDCYDFWNTERPHSSPNAMTTLLLSQTDLAPSQRIPGWVVRVRYRFELIYKPGSSRILIYDAGPVVNKIPQPGPETLLWDFTLNDASYPGGTFAWYNFSQQQGSFGPASVETCAFFQAFAGYDRTISSGNSTALRGGTTCYDQTVTCEWRDTSNNNLVSTKCIDTVTPAGTTTYRLTITDSGNNSSSDTVTVTVQ